VWRSPGRREVHFSALLHDRQQERARFVLREGHPVSRKAAVVIVAVWLFAALAIVWLALRLLGRA
jgi:hypothetical protein